MRDSVDSTQRENKCYCNIRVTSLAKKCGDAELELLHRWLYLSRDATTKSRTPDFAHLLPGSRMPEAFFPPPFVAFCDPSIRITFAFEYLPTENDFFAC